jgi:hypothetical protein
MRDEGTPDQCLIESPEQASVHDYLQASKTLFFRLNL